MKKWEIKHSESKYAFNIVGTEIGKKYKIARVPYIYDKDFFEVSEKNRKEALCDAKLIINSKECFELLKLFIKDYSQGLGHIEASEKEVYRMAISFVNKIDKDDKA